MCEEVTWPVVEPCSHTKFKTQSVNMNTYLGGTEVQM
jgi:hypothetical protein